MSKLTVDIGRLDKRITIQRQDVITDTEGNQTQEWTDFHSCWASVNGVTGREYWQARQSHEENTVNFSCQRSEDRATQGCDPSAGWLPRGRY